MDRPVSSTTDPEGMSRSSLVEELYLNYEAIDRELGYLTDAVLGLKGGHTLVPLTITVKKEKGIKLLSIEVTDDGEPLWTHKYSTLENSALDRGSSQVFYKGAAEKDTHTLAITYEYVSAATGLGMGKHIVSELDVIGDAHYVEIVIRETDNGVEAMMRELDFLGTE